MKRLNENKLDKLFKDGLTGDENAVPFRNEDWKAMKKLLDKKQDKKVVAFRWRYYASGIAALLLLALGLLLLNKKENVINQRSKIVKKTSAQQRNYKPEIGNDQSGQQLSNPVSAFSANRKVQRNMRVFSRNSHPFLPLSAARKGRYHHSKKDDNSMPNTLQNILPDTTTPSKNPELLTTLPPAATSTTVTAATDTTKAVSKPKEKPKAEKKAVKPILKNSRPQFTLSILAAPDINGVGSFSRSRVGTNFGIMAGVQLFKKVSISTGIAYAVKPYESYNADYSSSFKPSITPTNIAANCKVLDIPVNVSYQLLSRGKDAFAIGTGLSSYLMLREHYRFDYAYNPEVAPFNLDISNRNRHWFGVLNLNVTYQRQLNSRFSLLVQPYYKIPLTGIGNGSVDLKSAGVALGASWNINPFGKPK